MESDAAAVRGKLEEAVEARGAWRAVVWKVREALFRTAHVNNVPGYLLFKHVRPQKVCAVLCSKEILVLPPTPPHTTT